MFYLMSPIFYLFPGAHILPGEHRQTVGDRSVYFETKTTQCSQMTNHSVLVASPHTPNKRTAYGLSCAHIPQYAPGPSRIFIGWGPPAQGWHIFPAEGSTMSTYRGRHYDFGGRHYDLRGRMGRRHGFLSGGRIVGSVANLPPKYPKNRKRRRIRATSFSVSHLGGTSPSLLFTYLPTFPTLWGRVPPSPAFDAHERATLWLQRAACHDFRGRQYDFRQRQHDFGRRHSEFRGRHIF